MMNGDLKQTFVRNALQQYFNDVEEAMRKQIQRKRAIDTKSLLNSLRHVLYEETQGASGALSFEEYGRFLDMGVTRGHPLGGIKETSIKLRNGRKQKKIKPRKIYSPVIWGKLNGLINDLAYGYTEETIATLKKQLNEN